MVLTKVSLFSGIGGDDLASEWAGIETICFVEKDKYCQKVLHRHWPDIPIIEKVQDVTKEKVMAYAYDKWKQQPQGGEQNIKGWTLDRSKEALAFTNCGTRLQADQTISIRGDNTRQEIGRRSSQDGYTIDIISGGFPCQPHSVAGKHKGSLDERNLWPEFRRTIGEIKPRWVVAENVPGIFSSDAGRFFGEVLADLAALGYSAGWCTYGAVDVGALHRRNRVFIVAYNKSIRWGTQRPESIGRSIPSDSSLANPPQRENNGRGRGYLDNAPAARESIDPAVISGGQDVPHTTESGLEKAESTGATSTYGCFTECLASNWWSVEPNVGRVVNGIPSRVDRLKGLGNAVVPQQIYPIYKVIVEVEMKKKQEKSELKEAEFENLLDKASQPLEQPQKPDSKEAGTSESPTSGDCSENHTHSDSPEGI